MQTTHPPSEVSYGGQVESQYYSFFKYRIFPAFQSLDVGQAHTKHKKSFVLASKQLSSEINIVFKSLHYPSSHIIPEPFIEMYFISK
ncbi:MAG: hypothetical protein HKN68_04145 [Saprospiraceae bacterium]|nr:hypothetical protein [Saprospiraceae bacterium]